MYFIVLSKVFLVFLSALSVVLAAKLAGVIDN
jgi:hypothetical protein